MGIEPTSARATIWCVNHFATTANINIYRISLNSIWWLRTESNRRHMDFQSIALPTELLSLKVLIESLSKNGGPDGTRTRDLLRDRQAF